MAAGRVARICRVACASMDSMLTDVDGRPIRRYVVRMQLMPQREEVEWRAVTSHGELKAAAMASAALSRSRPDQGVGAVTVEVEDRTEVDRESDLLDYWGGCD